MEQTGAPQWKWLSSQDIKAMSVDLKMPIPGCGRSQLDHVVATALDEFKVRVGLLKDPRFCQRLGTDDWERTAPLLMFPQALESRLGDLTQLLMFWKGKGLAGVTKYKKMYSHILSMVDGDSQDPASNPDVPLEWVGPLEIVLPTLERMIMKDKVATRSIFTTLVGICEYEPQSCQPNNLDEFLGISVALLPTEFWLAMIAYANGHDLHSMLKTAESPGADFASLVIAADLFVAWSGLIPFSNRPRNALVWRCIARRDKTQPTWLAAPEIIGYPVHAQEHCSANYSDQPSTWIDEEEFHLFEKIKYNFMDLTERSRDLELGKASSADKIALSISLFVCGHIVWMAGSEKFGSDPHWKDKLIEYLDSSSAK